jgi:hypothetical protein
MRGVVGDLHGSAAARFGAGDMFMLQGLHKPPVLISFLLR